MNPTMKAPTWEDLKLWLDTKAKEKKGHKAKKGKSSDDLLRRLGLTPLPQQPPPSPWSVTAQIAVFHRVRCYCGAEHITPNPGERFVRFTHRRNGTVWEIQRPASLINPTLPREIRFLDGDTQACPRCYTEAPTGQLNLAL